MRITPMVRAQLVIFAVVTVLSLVVVGVYYIRIPSMLGVGHTRLQVEFPTTGGLYESANVTFSGVVVGKVDSVKLTPTGVVASLSVDSAAEIPADSQASVHSVSAVGEQYVEFTPAPDAHGAGTLEDGAVITNGTVPVDVGTLLDQVDALLAKIQDTKLRRVLDEAFDAFNGTGEDLQRLLDSTALLAGDANENSDVIVELIEHAAPLLESQSATTEEIRAWTANLATTTDRLRANDPQLRDILQKAPGVAHQAQDLFASMNQSLPLLFSNLDTTARTLAIYHPNLRQTLVLYPRVLATLYTSLNSEDPRNGANVDFALGFEDPGTCTVGFLPMTPDRNGGDQTSRDLPPGMLCRVPQDSNLAVRGTRNFPCVEFPGRRASTPAECATGYEPLGENVPLPEGIPGLIPPPPAQDSQESVPQGTVVPASAHTENDGPAVYATTYDPISGDYFGPDGNMYNAGTGVTGDGTSASSGKGDGPTWESLIEGTVA